MYAEMSILARKPESKAIPIFPEVTGCSSSASNVLYDVKSQLVQITVVPVEILRRLGTKNLPLFGDEKPVLRKQKHCLTPASDSDVKSCPIMSNISLTLFAVLPNPVYVG